MSLTAQLRADSTGNLTVLLDGGLDFENIIPLRKELEEICADNAASVITIDMQSLDFVGSSGIGHFVETIKILHEKRKNVRLCNVRSEFIRVFKLYNFEQIEDVLVEFSDGNRHTLHDRFKIGPDTPSTT